MSRRWVRAAVGLLVVILMASAGALAVYVQPRNDEPRHPDVIVVLGGVGDERTELGIELADRYSVPLVLSSSAASFGTALGRACGTDAICVEPIPETTAGEAAHTAVLAAGEGWDHVIVATSDFHTSRARFLFRQCLGADRVDVIGRTSRHRDDMNPWLLFREALGIVWGATVARAC